MSFVRSEETAKAAKLVGAIVVVFGLAAWRVAGAISPPAKPASPMEAAPTAPTPTAPAPAMAAGKPEDDTIRLPKLLVASNVNPFRTIAVPDPTPLAEPHPTLSGTPVGPLASGRAPATPLAVATPLTTRPVAPPPAIAPAWAPLRVTGILAGPDGTAVLELGGESRVVSVGARLTDGTVVLKIDPATVTVRRGKETRTLDVGE